MTPALIPEADWRARAAAHRALVEPWVEAHRARRGRGEKHPVFDFLFTYYSYPPGRLLRWSPGASHRLENGASEFGDLPKWRTQGPHAVLARDAMGERERRTTHWVRALCTAVGEQPGRFGCFGLHEWAMVYGLPEGAVRHESYPLRLPPEEIGAVVDAGPLCCTHHDAFRFFTPGAAPLNASRPARDDRLQTEQPGCLHTNMDIYKWCYKLAPWVSSDLLGDAFTLAAEIRELDMRASPYDLRALGLDPIEIESPEGRAEYESAQRQFAARARPLRQRLVADCTTLIGEGPAA